MERFALFNCEWNCFNGFILQILTIGFQCDRSLFSINCSKEFLYLNLLFTEIKVFDKTI